jgi:hypothetical protein
MDNSLKISSSQSPLIMYLIAAGMAGVLIASAQYMYILFVLLAFGFLVGWKRSIEFSEGADAAIYRTALFGVLIRQHRVPLSEFKMIRNRIQFNGTRISGNTCVTEFVDEMGGVLKVRDESVGFSNNEPLKARRYVERISELTSIPKGALLIENP